MSVENEVEELRKELERQKESTEISMRAIAAISMKIKALTLPRDLKVSGHEEALRFIEGGMWQRREAIIAEFEDGRKKFVDKVEPRMMKVQEKIDRGGIQMDAFEDLYLMFQNIKMFSIISSES